jgi:hypothetical protein
VDLLDNAGNQAEQSPEEILASLRGGEETSPENPAAPEKAAPPEMVWDPKALKYTVEGGKEVVEPWEMVQKRASLGYHYAQRAQLLNSQEEKYKQLDEQNKKLARWQEFNEYSEKNPDWWKHVETSWQNRQAPQAGEQVDNPLLPKIGELEAQLKELSAFKEQFVQKQQSLEHEAQDKDFRSEIDQAAKLGKQYDLDLEAADEQGVTGTWKVLEHMKSMGLDGSKKGHFSAAFKDLYLDHLLSRNAEKTKEQHAKSQEQARKAGIVSVSKQPTGRGNGTLNGKIPSMSWGELGDLALADKEIFGR